MGQRCRQVGLTLVRSYGSIEAHNENENIPHFLTPTVRTFKNMSIKFSKKRYFAIQFDKEAYILNIIKAWHNSSHKASSKRKADFAHLPQQSKVHKKDIKDIFEAIAHSLYNQQYSTAITVSNINHGRKEEQ